MSRHPLLVRCARPDDAGALLDLWQEAPAATPGGASSDTEVEAFATKRLGALSEADDEALLVAEREGQVVGALHVEASRVSPIHAERIASTTYLVVHPEWRRLGVGHALLEAAVGWAETRGLGCVSAVVSGASRETNRYFARRGLTTTGTVRQAATPLLRKKLAPEVLRGSPGTSRRIGTVLAARRSLRRQAEDPS